MTTRLSLLAATACGCAASGSPLVESGPQVELVANPGGVPDHAPLQLTLTTWNHLAALQDATESGQLEATLDGTALVLDPSATGPAGIHDRYVASFVLPARVAQVGSAASTITVSDQQTTWSVQVPDLLTNDLQPVGAMVANQHDTLVWPSAATVEPYSTIDWACIAVEQRVTACQSDTTHDPGVAIAKEHVELDLTARAGERFTVWAQRFANPTASGDGPTFFVSILGRVDGTFE